MRSSIYISRIFFPKKCIHCDRIIPFSDSYCHSCTARECTVPEGFCFHCNKRQCRCDDFQPRLRHITAPFIYADAVRELILNLKFRKKKYCAELLSDKIAQKVVEDFSGTDFDFVTFVPMSRRAKHLRGYNQSEVIARRVAEKLFLPCSEALIKTKDTFKQHHLSGESRRKNLADTITLKEGTDIKRKTVLIIDDIKTTGSTLSVCESVLLSAGASDVFCAVAAVPVFGNIPVSIDKKDKNI